MGDRCGPGEFIEYGVDFQGIKEVSIDLQPASSLKFGWVLRLIFIGQQNAAGAQVQVGVVHKWLLLPVNNPFRMLLGGMFRCHKADWHQEKAHHQLGQKHLLSKAEQPGR